MFVLLEIGQLVTEPDPPGRKLLRTRRQQRLESNLGKVHSVATGSRYLRATRR
jgi:hypothetical protein